MATSTQVVSEEHPIVDRGDLPTRDEFSRVEHSIMDLMEFGTTPLLERIVDLTVSAHENGLLLDGITFDYVGRYAQATSSISELSDQLAEQAKRLKAYRYHFEQIALADGKVFDEPPFESAYGAKYKASRLATANGGKDA